MTERERAGAAAPAPAPVESGQDERLRRTAAALQERKAEGRATGGVPPYGSRFIDGRRVEHPDEQATLRALLAARAAGLSWAKVADKLNAAGHRTRTGRQWSRQGAAQVHATATR